MRNEGTFPVLIGDTTTNDVMLSSPIILYDFPAVAPESAGDFCDSTEIDEILALRVMTLTDDEKAEARGTDARAAAIIDRCDDMPDEIWSRLHGAVRSLRPIESARRDERITGDRPDRSMVGSGQRCVRSIRSPTRCASAVSKSATAPVCG